MLESYKVIRFGFCFIHVHIKPQRQFIFCIRSSLNSDITSLDIDISSFFQLKIACRHCRSSFSATLDRKFPK